MTSAVTPLALQYRSSRKDESPLALKGTASPAKVRVSPSMTDWSGRSRRRYRPDPPPTTATLEDPHGRSRITSPPSSTRPRDTEKLCTLQREKREQKNAKKNRARQ
ncbi:hypothetical protein SDC9_63554 [bioreactor metagenome]|uniref:Uncharacterized protein n=1 Tax=bioreactor metagenome TaxID=1076179 RepID=A0A644XLT6_9ZZZZ